MDGKRSALIVANYDYEDPGLRSRFGRRLGTPRSWHVLRDPEIGGFEVRMQPGTRSPTWPTGVEEFFAERRPTTSLYSTSPRRWRWRRWR